MARTVCPHCKCALSPAERTAHNCPVCKEPLDGPARQEATPARDIVKSGDVAKPEVPSESQDRKLVQSGKFHVTELDAETIKYLKKVENNAGHGSGVFLPIAMAGLPKRAWHALAILLGAGGIALTAVIYNSGEIHAGLQALSIFLAASVGVFLWGCVALSRPAAPSFGRFLWFDARNFWKVNGSRVEVQPLSKLRDARCKHFLQNGAYQHSELVVEGTDISERHTLPSKFGAERVTRFVATVCMLRNQQDGDTGDENNVIGLLAAKVANSGAAALNDISSLMNIEINQPVFLPGKSRQSPPRRSLLVTLSPFAAAILVGVAGWFGLPALDRFQHHSRAYEEVVNAAPGDERPFERYAADYPDGNYTDTVKQIHERNLREFAEASPRGEQERYRRYLAAFPDGESADEVKRQYEDNLFDYASDSTLGDLERYEKYLDAFPAGKRRTDLLQLQEENLRQYALASPPGVSQRFNTYAAKFPISEHAESVRNAYEENLRKYAIHSPEGETSRFSVYLNNFRKHENAEEVHKAFEKNLREYAVAATTGDLTGYRLYMRYFSEHENAPEIRDDFEDNLRRYALASAAGDERRFLAYLEEFASHSRVGEVRKAYEKNLYDYAIASPPGLNTRYEQYLERFALHERAPEVTKSYEQNLYQYALTTDKPGVCEAYLQQFPDGSHADEITRLADDRRFEAITRKYRGDRQLQGLRLYLSETRNQTHRDDAQNQVDAVYDKVIKDLKTRTTAAKADEPAKADESMIETMTFLLNGMKKAESSRVRVRFIASHDSTPTTSTAKLLEKVQYQAYLKQSETLQRLDEEGTALMPLGKVFDKDQIGRREAIILTRFREAVEKVIPRHVLEIVSGLATATVSLDIAYHAYPPGAVFVYQVTRTGSNGPESTTAKGLLRGYFVNWTINVKLQDEPEPHVFKLKSNPASSMRYDDRPGDPAWAPYAILLYSAFYDMSNKFIGGFGIDPGPVPKGYRFTQATGIETYSYEDLRTVVAAALREIGDKFEADDRNALSKAVSTGRFGEADKPQKKAAKELMETILDKYPQVNFAVMSLLRKQLEEKKRPSPYYEDDY